MCGTRGKSLNFTRKVSTYMKTKSIAKSTMISTPKVISLALYESESVPAIVDEDATPINRLELTQHTEL